MVFRVAFCTTNRCGCIAPPLRPPGPAATFALIDTASNAGSLAGAATSRVWGGGFRAPTATGATKTTTAAAVRSARFNAPGALTASFVMISSMRFFKSDPVTPDTHASGDSTKN